MTITAMALSGGWAGIVALPRAGVDSPFAHSPCANFAGRRTQAPRLARMAADDELHWDDLRYFLRAVQAGTLAGAARAMGVEHSTVGRRLAALERALGVPVVVRAPDGLHLTPTGEGLVPLVEAVERAVLAVHGRATQREVRVRLAMPTGFTALFTAHLHALRAAHPQLTLELLTGAKAIDLQRGEAELAIRSGPVSAQELIARPLGESGWSLYASPAYLARRPAPDDALDLRGHELIGYDPSLSEVPAARWVEQRLRDGATLALRSREMTDMLAASLGGAGLAVLPCLIGDETPGLLRLTPAVLATRSLSLVYPREARMSAPVQAVIRFVIDVMRENAGRIAGTAGRAAPQSGAGSSASTITSSPSSSSPVKTKPSDS
jgi:DNA-binding transcriptional LysR family regulator